MKHKIDKAKVRLPLFFKPILWSYNFNRLLPLKNKKSIILNSINYGDLRHWRWIINFYGKKTVKKELLMAPASAIRIGARKLSGAIFNIRNFNYAPRGIKRKT